MAVRLLGARRIVKERMDGWTPVLHTFTCHGGALFPGRVLLQCGGNDPSDTGKICLSRVGTRHWLAHGSVLHDTDSRIHAVLLLHLNRDPPAGMSSFTTPLLLFAYSNPPTELSLRRTKQTLL